MLKASVLLAIGTLVALLVVSFTLPVSAQETIPSLSQIAQIGVAATEMVFDPPYLYLLTEAGVSVYDLSNPEVPAALGLYETDADLINLTVQGQRLYATDGRTLYVIDVAQPINPTLAAEFEFGTGVPFSPIAADEGNRLYALVSLSDFGLYSCELRTYDITNPNQTVLIDTIPAVARHHDRRCGRQIFLQDQVAVFEIVSGQSHGGCCSYVAVAGIGDDGSLSLSYQLAEGFPYAFQIAPNGSGTVYLTAGVYEQCEIPGTRTAIHSFQIVAPPGDVPPLTAGSHVTCGGFHTALAATADRLYVIHSLPNTLYSRLVAYDTTQAERRITAFQFVGIGLQISAADVIVIRTDDSIRVLRWIETPITLRSFAPIASAHADASRVPQ